MARDGRRWRFRPPRWHESNRVRPRILVEHADGEVRTALAARLREHGFEVVTCSGPTEGARGCPVVEGQPCPGAAGADAVVAGLPHPDPITDEILAAFDRVHPSLPVVIDFPVSHSSAQDVLLRPHRWSRTVVAPLVRQLHRVLEQVHAKA